MRQLQQAAQRDQCEMINQTKKFKLKYLLSANTTAWQVESQSVTSTTAATPLALLIHY